MVQNEKMSQVLAVPKIDKKTEITMLAMGGLCAGGPLFLDSMPIDAKAVTFAVTYGVLGSLAGAAPYVVQYVSYLVMRAKTPRQDILDMQLAEELDCIKKMPKERKPLPHWYQSVLNMPFAQRMSMTSLMFFQTANINSQIANQAATGVDRFVTYIQEASPMLEKIKPKNVPELDFRTVQRQEPIAQLPGLIFNQ